MKKREFSFSRWFLFFLIGSCFWLFSWKICFAQHQKIRASASQLLFGKWIISPHPQGKAPRFAWFVLDQIAALVYQLEDRLNIYSKSQEPILLPSWMKINSISFLMDPNQLSFSQHGKRYIRKNGEQAQPGITSLQVSTFTHSHGWDVRHRFMEGGKQISARLSADGELLALLGRLDKQSVEILTLSTPVARVLWHQNFSTPYLGFTVVSYGHSAGMVIIVTKTNAVFFQAKTGATRQVFSYSSAIQNQMNSLWVFGKNQKVTPRIEITPYGNGMAVLKQYPHISPKVSQVEIRQVRTGRLLYRLVGVPSQVDQVKFSWDGKQVAVSGKDGSLQVYSIP